MPTETPIAQEIDALRALYDALHPLDQDGRRRVLRWVVEVFADKTATGRPTTNGHATPIPSLSPQSIRMKKVWQAKRETGTRAAPGGFVERLRAQRQTTADRLATFDLVTPRPSPGATAGALVRRGYLKKKGDGYVRTAKAYDVVPPKAPR